MWPREAEVLPRQQETVSRRAESAAKGMGHRVLADTVPASGIRARRVLPQAAGVPGPLCRPATVPASRPCAGAGASVKRIVHLGSGAVIVPRLPAAARNAKVVRWMVLFGMLLIAIRCILDPAVTLAGGAQR